MTTKKKVAVSYLKDIYPHPADGQPRLAMGRITGCDDLPDFPALRDVVLRDLRYPHPQSSKFEAYGWVPTLFGESSKVKRRPDGQTYTVTGSFRVGSVEGDRLCVMYCDVDNARDDLPHVTASDVAAGLQSLGLTPNFFTHTSFNHTPQKHKFRVVFEVDRDITRSEMTDLYVWLNTYVMGGQADGTIYDPADFLFGPPHVTTTTECMTGSPLAVDILLEAAAELRKTQRHLWTDLLTTRQTAKRELTPEEKARAVALMADHEVRPHVSVTNRDFVNPAWLDLYRDAKLGRGHWHTMRSIMARIWTKSGASLTRGEMEHIFSEVDAVAGNYFTFTHGSMKRAELLDWVMSLPVETDPDPLLQAEKSNLVIHALEGECGEGKTHFMLSHMARERGRYVYVVDKIDNIEHRRVEFFKIAGQNAPRFKIYEAHSREASFRVVRQLDEIRAKIAGFYAGSAVIVFVSQAGAALMDWSAWPDFQIIYDEVPDSFSLVTLDAKNHRELVRNLVEVDAGDGNCYRLRLTEDGENALRRDADDYDKVHHGLLRLLNRPTNNVWVRQAAWDQGDSLEFFCFASPLNLLPFRKVWMLGDHMTRSITANMWSSKWEVRFEHVEFPRRQRPVPMAGRTFIHYFSNHRDASITRYREGDLPLLAITEWIAKHAAGEPVLWTANERLKAHVALKPADYQQPKAHGRNDLQHYKRIAWLAAMKPNKFEIATLREMCGMSAAELIEWREYNALYQFMMRGDLRVFDSEEVNHLYVFSRQQAEYLHQRTGGKMLHEPGLVADPARSVADEPMTPAERQQVKYWRDKLLASGLDDVRALRKGDKLTDRMVQLVNATARQHRERRAA